VLHQRPDLGQYRCRRGRVAFGQTQPDQGKASQRYQRRPFPNSRGLCLRIAPRTATGGRYASDRANVCGTRQPRHCHSLLYESPTPGSRGPARPAGMRRRVLRLVRAVESGEPARRLAPTRCGLTIVVAICRETAVGAAVQVVPSGNHRPCRTVTAPRSAGSHVSITSARARSRGFRADVRSLSRDPSCVPAECGLRC
jgi:hypothetical protein